MSKETPITLIGNVVGPPQKNRTANGSVTKFRVASTAQRYDKDLQRWVDKKPLFLDVECWGDLGGNVSHSVSKGDPVIVVGELYTDEWDSDQGRRSKNTVRAEAVGLNLVRGVADFTKSRREAAAPSEGVPEPAEPDYAQPAPADPDEPRHPVPDDAEDIDFRAGKDYVMGSETLDDMDSEETFREPALH